MMLFKKPLLAILSLLLVGLAYGYVVEYSRPLFSKGDSYAHLWKRVDSCENKGLTESARKIVEEIYARAKAEDQADQFVKAVIYKMKLASYKEEFSQEKNINDLQTEVGTARFPAKPVLQSVLADAYWQYYQANRWKFYNRSQTTGFDKGDVSTYDLKSLVNEVISNYAASLRDTALLKQTKLDGLEEILIPGPASMRLWRPTLYDFLAHRALDFYKNSEAEVTKAANQFSVNDEAYLNPYPEFLKLTIAKPADSLELKYYSAKLFQSLLAFHQADGNEEALLDLEIERLQFANNYSKNENKDSLYLQTLGWLEKRFAKSSRCAEVYHLEALWWLSKAPQYNPLQGDKFKWNRKKALEICQAILKDHPKTRGAQLAKNTVNEIRAEALTINVEEQNDVQLPNRVLVNYTNLSKVYFKIVKVNYLEYYKLLHDNYYQDKEAIAKVLSQPQAQAFEQVLPDDQDFNAHAAEAKIPALAAGCYVVLTSSTPQFLGRESSLSYALYVVSDLACLNKRQPKGGYDLHILNRQTGKAIKNATAQIWYNVYNSRKEEYELQKGKTYSSDENGYLSLLANEKGNYASFFIEIIYGDDRLLTNTGFYYNYYENNGANPTVISSFIFTDRAIYRPGQTVYFKSILLQNSGRKHELLPTHPVTVYFYDVNHQKIASQDLVTNEYGTVSGSFTAPQGGLTGQMMITDEHGTAYISVEEYKRPKFEVNFDTLRGSYQLKEEATVRGFAKAYAGNFVDGADVKYRVVRRVNYPDWWYWYRSYSQKTTEVEIVNGSTKTDENGYYEIKFTALPDPTVSGSDNPTYTYEIHADVTDLNGETRSAQTDFKVGYKSIELSFSSPEVVNIRELPKMSISAANLNGIEEKVNGQLKVYELKQPEKVFRKRLWTQPDKHIYSQEEYYRLFPNDLYGDETNRYTWKKLRMAFSRSFNTATDKDIVISEFKDLSPGVYLAESTCLDKNGGEVKAINYITVYDPASKKLPYKTAQWTFDVQSVAESGEKGSFVLASSYDDITYLYEVEGEERQEIAFMSPSLKPVEVAVTEADRGGIMAAAYFVKYGRFYSSTHYITVPFSNKELDIEYASFRNKLLPGQQEEWKLTIKNKKGEKAAAEMVATLYDASLDAFRPNYWNFGIYSTFYPRFQWSHSLEQESRAYQHSTYTTVYTDVDNIYYDRLNYFGLNWYGQSYRYRNNAPMKKDGRAKEKSAVASYANDRFLDESEAAPAQAMAASAPGVSGNAEDLKADKTANQPAKEPGAGEPDRANKKQETAAPRKNFNETAFFFPQLQTNEQGEIVISFTIPESLTRWKFMGLAHTKDLSYGQTQKEVVTQKELMVVPNAPRFFREGDKMTFASKISNLSENELKGTVSIQFFDAFTEREMTAELLENNPGTKDILVKKGQSTIAEWDIRIPEGVEALKYKVMARAGNFSDGEEMVLPVLTNRMLVTESLPLPVRGNQSKEFTFTKFVSQNNGSATLRNHAYTLEFTANPAWYAIQSLPYLMEYPYECAEQTFARYYSNALASYVVNSKPKIKQVFESWKLKSPESFLSNLEKNQELKSLLLEETPWVMQSKNESENKKRVALLFDLNKMTNELNAAINKLAKMQLENGAWPWFTGCPGDAYITRHVLTGFGHLQKLGVLDLKTNATALKMVEAALPYCDRKLKKDYEWIKRHHKDYQNEDHLGSMAIHYLYMRSYFKDHEVGQGAKEAVEYFKKQAQKYWLSNSRYMQGMIALALNRAGDKKTATDILRSLKENALNSEEMGMYWKDNSAGYYWYQAPIEMQALMIEAFDEINGDAKAVDDLKTWLIKNKQTQHWGSTRATTEAVYALLLHGSDWLGREPEVEISLGTIKLDPKTDPQLQAEAGTGYFKKTYTGADIQPAMGKIKVVKKDAGVSWGAVYWQYFEQLDHITAQETPLKLVKKLFLQSNTASGPVITPITATTVLKPGDKIKVRIELKVDRDMDYVHLKDMRAAGFEPLNVLSGYHYQDGLGYYESTRDAATNFFISYLPKGSYVFEYPVVVSHYGDFSNGVSSIQCMYAPEFTSHSEGIRVSVRK